jgi:hypothetical protein
MTLEVSTTGKEVRNNQRKAEEYISASSEVDSDTLMTYTRIVFIALCSGYVSSQLKFYRATMLLANSAS